MDTVMLWLSTCLEVVCDYIKLCMILCDGLSPKTALLGGVSLGCVWRLVMSLLEFAWYGEPVTAAPLCGGAVAFFSVSAIVH